MSDDYELKPVEPKKTETSPAEMGPLDLSPPIPPAGIVGDAGKQGEVKPDAAAPGEPSPAAPAGFVPPVPIIEGPDEEEGPAPPDPEDVEKNKGVAIVSYVPPLFLVPLLVAPNSRYARFHANQGLLLAIVALAATLVAAILEICIVILFPFLRVIHLDILATLGTCAAHVGAIFLIIAVAVVAVCGIVNAANGELKPLPLIGRYTLIR